MSAGQALLIGIILIATIISLISLRRRRDAGGPSPRAYVREMAARLKDQQGVKSDITELMTQLQQVSREINAQLDAKFIKLQQVIGHADDRLDRLDRHVRRDDGQPALDITVSDDTETAPREPVRSIRDARNRVVALASEGLPSAEIAEQVGLSEGEVDLVLRLGLPLVSKVAG